MIDDSAAELARNADLRFAALSELFDGETRRRLLDRGVAAGWRCLEVGAGSGTVARWLSDEVGASGRILATDLDTRVLDTIAGGNLEIRRHDVTCDPLPERAFDVVHARMLLIHLPERDRVLQRLAAAVAPGGWLVCEEFDALSMPPDPILSPGEAALQVHEAMARLGQDVGMERRVGRLLFGKLRALGLADVGATGRLSMATSGSALTRLLRASYESRRREMIARGYISAAEFDRDMSRLDDERFMMPSPIMWSAWGRRRADP